MLGAEHPDTASSLNNLAGLLQAQGDLAGAPEPIQKAMQVSLANVLPYIDANGSWHIGAGG